MRTTAQEQVKCGQLPSALLLASREASQPAEPPDLPTAIGLEPVEVEQQLSAHGARRQTLERLVDLL